MSLTVPVAILVVLAAAVALGVLRLRAATAAARAAQGRAAALRARVDEAADALRAEADAGSVVEPWDAAADARLFAALGAFDDETAERRVDPRPDPRSGDRRRSRPTRTPSPRLRRDP